MRLFTSYARTDRPRAGRVSQDLRTAGHEVWLDMEMPLGRPWWDTILAEIRNSDAVIAVISSSSLKSRACQAERDYAAQLGKPILPVTVEPVSASLMPPELIGLDAIDYTQISAAYQLIRAVEKVDSAPRLPEPLPTPLPPLY